MTDMAEGQSCSERAGADNLMALVEHIPVLREGIQAYVALWKLHRDMHPAVLAAILTRPAGERRDLLEAVGAFIHRNAEPEPEGQGGRRGRGTSMDSDDLWEDALDESLQQTSEACPEDGCEKVNPNASSVLGQTASPERLNTLGAAQAPIEQRSTIRGPEPQMEVADVRPDSPELLTDLERAAERCREAWRATRDLAHWERYLKLRRCIDDIRRGKLHPLGPKLLLGLPQLRIILERDELVPQRIVNVELAKQRELHEARLQELCRRRQRLKWARQHDEQRLRVQVQEQRRFLEEELQRLERERELRRCRVQQRLLELRLEDPEPEPKSASQSPQSEDEFTHAWDDIQMWEHIISSPEKDHNRNRTLRPIENKENQQQAAASAPAQGPALHKQPEAARPKRTGYHQRKRWFEQALLAWQAQDDVPVQAATPATWFCAEQPWAAWQSHTHPHLRLL